MSTHSERKEEREREKLKVFIAVLLFFITSMLCSSIIVALADWHMLPWTP